MVFVESPWFDAWRAEHLDDDAFRALQLALLAHPLYAFAKNRHTYLTRDQLRRLGDLLCEESDDG
jgi:hypothetical protein